MENHSLITFPEVASCTQQKFIGREDQHLNKLYITQNSIHSVKQSVMKIFHMWYIKRQISPVKIYQWVLKFKNKSQLHCEISS